MKKRIAIAPGDPAGIGYEISAKAIQAMRNELSSVIPVVYAQKEIWQRACELFARDLKMSVIEDIE